MEEYSEAGFKGHIEEYTSENYINYPVLTAKKCIKMDFAPDGKFMEIKIGVIPHLDKVTLSIKEGSPIRIMVFIIMSIVFYANHK